MYPQMETFYRRSSIGDKYDGCLVQELRLVSFNKVKSHMHARMHARITGIRTYVHVVTLIEFLYVYIVVRLF